jgi:GNAT superfamily N-acetyltransferase
MAIAEIDITPIHPDEAETVVELAGRVWRAHYPGIISAAQIEYMLEQRYRPVLVKQFIARGDTWLAARAEGAMVGFAHGHPLSGGDYKLDKLYVDGDWQRHGIGGALIRALAARAAGHGFTRLILRVNRENHPAIKSYFKHGFKIADLVQENIGGGFVMDDYVMARDLEKEPS